MKTSYYGRINSRAYLQHRQYGVQISANARYWNGPKYEPLFPMWEMVRYKDKEKYEEMYRKQILSKLDPLEVYNDLGEDAILLCHESIAKIESGETFCHRHIVARWLEEELSNKYGIDVKIEELADPNASVYKCKKKTTKTIIEEHQVNLSDLGLY